MANVIYDYCIYYEENLDGGLFGDPCSKYSHKLNGLCNGHQQYLDDIDKYENHDKYYTISYVRTKLAENGLVYGRIKKTYVCKEMFLFLQKHKYFLEKNQKFKETVIDKLKEFSFETNDVLEILELDKLVEGIFPYLELVGNNITEKKIIEKNAGIKRRRKEKSILENKIKIKL